MTTHSYCLTESRLPIFKNIIEVLLARRFKQEATVDSESARYGGKAGCWLEGAPGAGKTKLIKSALDALGYRQYSIDDMYHHSDGTNTNAYYQVPASMNIGALRKHVNYAFQHGLVLKIDEFDVLINTDSAYGEEASRFMAELNAYLMGEDLYHMRPSRPGFTLLITGNGIAMSGRELLSDAFRSRIDEHRVPTYRQNECIEILFAENKGLEAKFSNSIDLQSEVYAFIQQYMQNPQQYTFRSLLDDVSALNDSIPSIPAPTSPPVIFSRQVTQRSMSSFGNVRHNKCVII